MFGIICIYICMYVWDLLMCIYSLINSPLQCLRTCHRIHRSCPRLQEVVHVSHAPLITFVFNCCGMDGSHWGLLTRLSRIWVYIYNMYRIHTCTWIHRCICLYMYVHVCICIFLLYVCVYVYVYVYVNVYVYVYVHVLCMLNPCGWVEPPGWGIACNWSEKPW